MDAIPWFKVDDGLPTSRKLLSIPRRMRLPTLGLWTIAGAWSAGELTDGHVPSYMLEEWGATVAQAECLVNAGLWFVERNGYVFHDWHDYQPERSKVLEERENAKIRMKRVREARRSGEQVTNVQANDDRTSGEVRLAPTRPVPTSSSTKKKPLSATRGSRLEPSWLPTAEDIAKVRAECPDVDPQREHAAFVDYWIAVPGNRGVKVDWSATWRNWMRRKQADVKGKPTPTDRAKRTVMLATELLEVES